MDQHPVQGEWKYCWPLHATETGISSGSYMSQTAPRLHLDFQLGPTPSLDFQVVLNLDKTAALNLQTSKAIHTDYLF